jgi:predicted esterase
MKRLIIFISIYAISTFCEGQSAPTWTARPGVAMSPKVNGFYEYLPLGYVEDVSVNYPVIIFFPGAGETGNGTTELFRMNNAGLGLRINQGNFPQVFTYNSINYKFIVIGAQTTQELSNNSEVDGVIEYVKANYRVDLNRIYLTGLSLGGGTALRHISGSLAQAQKIAAVAVQCPFYNVADASPPQQIAAANVPVITFHDPSDPQVSIFFSNNLLSQVNGANPAPQTPARKIELAGTPGFIHNVWDEVLNPIYQVPLTGGLNMYQWLLQYTRAPSVPVITTNTIKIKKRIKII